VGNVVAPEVAGRRVPVQADRNLLPGVHFPPGTVSWDEHVEAWNGYAKHFGRDQDAERIAARGGFSFVELCAFLGRPPATWHRVGLGEVGRGADRIKP